MELNWVVEQVVIGYHLADYGPELPQGWEYQEVFQFLSVPLVKCCPPPLHTPPLNHCDCLGVAQGVALYVSWQTHLLFLWGYLLLAILCNESHCRRVYIGG